MSKRQMPLMSSKQIADYTKRSHETVRKDIERMLDELSEPRHKYSKQSSENLKLSTEYALPQDLVFTLIATYEAKTRRKIVNRWLNMLDQFIVVSFSCNKLDKRAHGYTGTVGVTAVSLKSGNVSWSANINHEGKRHYLGSFKTYEEARAARLEAEKRLGVKRN